MVDPLSFDWSQDANLSASALIFFACTRTVITYHRRAPWRSSRIGRHIVTVTASVGLLGLYTVVVTLWPGTLLALRVVRTVLLVVLAYSMHVRARLVIDAQREIEPPPGEKA
ncbi:putative phage holin [Kitasatospora mediocidica]|uniref:putative phage holin n=1 Tax=Kitasatospora mediocidica TaxID=58352 RepID=UPI00055E42E4|nr:hypothetical protein [Kitasatospora mediocidica]